VISGRWSAVSRPFPSAAVAATALYGFQDTPDIAGYLFNPSILLRHLAVLLFHPREDLADLLPMLFELVNLPEDDLAQIADDGSNSANLATEVLNAGAPPGILRLSLGSLFGKLGRRRFHMIPENSSQPLQRQPVIRLSHLLSLLEFR
jgi:hypothetical protein